MSLHYQFALASQRAYAQHTHEAGDSQALLEMRGGLTTLAFRGTERDFGDIITDLRALPWYDSTLGAWCHSGFLKATRALFPVLLSDVMALVSKGHVIHLTGHSLGAAQATIFACMLRAKGLAQAHQMTVTGFGSPRPQYGSGLDKWLKDVDVSLYKKGSDAITGVPRLGSHVREPLTQLAPADTFGRSCTSERYKDHRIARYIASL